MRWNRRQNMRSENKSEGKQKQSNRDFAWKTEQVRKLKKLFEAKAITVDQLMQNQGVTAIAQTNRNNSVGDIRLFFETSKENSPGENIESEVANSLSVSVKRSLNKVTDKSTVKSASKAKKCVSKRRIHTSGNSTRSKRCRSASAIDNPNIDIGVRFLSQPSTSLLEGESCESDSILSGDFNFHTPNASFDVDEEETAVTIDGQQHIKRSSSKPSVLEKKCGVENSSLNMEEGQVMGYATVLQMFNELKEEIKKEHQKTRSEDKLSLQNFKSEVIEDAKKEAAQVAELSNVSNEEMKKVKRELSMYKQRTKVLTDVCDRFQTQITDLEHRLDNMEMNSCKKMIIITGLTLESTKKSEMALEVQDFLEKNLLTDVCVDDIFTLGHSNPKPLVVSFPTFQEKSQVLKNKSLLKSLRVRIYINDYVPAATQEKRRREGEVKEIAEAENMQVSYFNGKMTIQGHYYKPMVTVPSPKDLINLDYDELHEIQKIDFNRGDEFQKEGSKFVTYVAKAENGQQIRRMYVKMKIIQPAARHIPCAYWLPGEQQKYLNQSFVDDGEPGSGRVLLDILKDKNMEGYVVFGVRKYGGTKIGADRFTCYAMATYSALGFDPDSYQRLPPKRSQQSNQQTKPKTVSSSQESLDQLRNDDRDQNYTLMKEYGADAMRGARPKHWRGGEHRGRGRSQYRGQHHEQRGNNRSSYRGAPNRARGHRQDRGISARNYSSSSNGSGYFNYSFSKPMQIDAPREDWSPSNNGQFE